MLFGDSVDITSKMRRLGIRRGIVEGHFDLMAFARMLAKIAHSFAVAELGLSGFEHYLPQLILKYNSAIAGYLIGNCIRELPIPRDPPINQIAFGLTKYGMNWNVFVTIRLFAPHGTPSYSVVAGKLIPNDDPIARHGRAIRSAMLVAGAQQLPAWLPDFPR